MKLKPKYVYGGRWSVAERNRHPISAATYEIYLGEEDRSGLEEHLTWLEGRPVIIKTLKYPHLATQDDIIKRRQAFREQLNVLALPHFMIPEPLDYCEVTDHHTPELANTELGASEPMLVYAYSPGRTLRDHVDGGRGGPQPLEPLEALETLRRIVSFLEYLHEAGYGHAAVNPDHFLYHNGSLRALGLSKIVPLDRAAGRLNPHERPVFSSQERAYLPSTAIIEGSYGYDTEIYGLGMLLFFLLSGRCPSTLQRSSPDGLPQDEIAALAVAPKLQLLITQLTAWPRQKTAADSARAIKIRIEQAMETQAEFDEARALLSCKVGIFADLENMMASFRGRRESEPPGDGQRTGPRELGLDLDAISSAYLQYGQAYKVVVLGRHNVKGLAMKAVAQLQRSGWKVIPVDSTVSADGKIIMGEVDDSVLINEGNKFLEFARPEHFVLVSNDSDYQRLLEKAQIKGCRVTLIYGSVRGRSTVSGDYLRQITDQRIHAHHIGTYPFVFSQETSALLDSLGRKLPRLEQRQTTFKLLTWEFVRQFGYERGRDLLRTVDLARLDEFVPEQVPWVVSVVGQADKPMATVEQLNQRRKVLSAFQKASPAILNELLALPVGRDSILNMLADEAEFTQAEWPFIQANLRNPELIRIFVRHGLENEQLRSLIRAAPGEMQDLLKTHRSDDLGYVLKMFGPEGLVAVRQHGGKGLALLRQYGAEALQVLRGPKARVLIDLTERDPARRWIDQWYKRAGNLGAFSMLLAEPGLEEHARRDDIGVFAIYQAEGSLKAVEQSHVLAGLVFKDIEVAYELRRQLLEEGVNVGAQIARLQSVRRQIGDLFRRVEQPDALVELVRAVAEATDEGVVGELSKAYLQIGPAVLEAYRQHGRAIFALIDRTDHRVVHLLKLFPESLPDLQKYGRPAYQLIREFQEVGHAALVRLRYRDLRPFFAQPALLDTTRAWHRDYGNLQCIDWLTDEPSLAEALGNHGLVVLELYAADQDLALIRDAIAAAPVAGSTVQEMYKLLRETSVVPRGDLMRLLTDRRDLLRAASSPAERAQFVRALYSAELLHTVERLDRLIAQSRPAALNLFDQHALALFTVVEATGPEAVAMLVVYPGLFPDLERYGQAAYKLVERYQDLAVTALAKFRDVNLLPLLNDQTAQGLITLWHNKTRDLAALDLLIEQPNILAWTRRYATILTQDATGAAVSLAEGAADIMERYWQHRSAETITQALSLAERGYIGFPEGYDLLYGAQRPAADVATIIAVHGERLRAIGSTADRQSLVQMLYDAQGRNVGAEVTAAFDENPAITLAAYRKVGAEGLDLTRHIEPRVLYMLAQSPELLPILQRYGAAAYSFVRQFEAEVIGPLLALQGADLTNLLSEVARQTIVKYRTKHPDYKILRVLIVDWGARPFFDRYALDQVMACWLLLREHQPATSPSTLLAQFEEILFSSRVPITRIVPLIGRVSPLALKNAVMNHSETLFTYTELSEQVRFCLLLSGTFRDWANARRYSALTESLDRTLLLSAVEQGGLDVVTVLERLQPVVRPAALARLHRLPNAEITPFVTNLLKADGLLSTATAQEQERLLQASERVSIEVALEVLRDYGEAGLSETIKTGKIGWLFKLTRRRR